MKNLKKIIAVVLVVGIGAGLVMRFSGSEPEEEYEYRPTVSTVTPEQGDIYLYTELTGTIEPQTKAAVMPKMGGEVLEVYFQAGDYVEAGTALCEIDSDALTSLKLQVDSALVSVNDCNRNLSRTQVLFANGDVSSQTLEQIQNAAENARIAYESAKNQYELHLEYTTVTAPISGTIESRNVEPHQFVGNTSQICVISAKEQLQVNFGITEKTLNNISLGDAIEIEKNGAAYQGTVTEISSMVNSMSGLYDVKAVITESQGLTTGTKVKLTALMSQAQGVMTVPLDTVRYDNGSPFVYCYEETPRQPSGNSEETPQPSSGNSGTGVARKCYIESGIYDSERMEVSSGLDQNSQIITTWSNELVDGEEVLLKGAVTDAADDKIRLEIGMAEDTE